MKSENWNGLPKTESYQFAIADVICEIIDNSDNLIPVTENNQGK